MISLITMYGQDWSSMSEKEIRNLDLNNRDLRGIVFPKIKDFFKMIRKKSICGAYIDSDLSEYNLEGVHIREVKFQRGANIPDDAELFQKIKYKDLFGVRLPEKDYSKYNFKGVDIRGIVFTKNSKLPSDENFFKDMDNLTRLYEPERLSISVFPEMNYEKYNFDKVNMEGFVFFEKSIFPKKREFFQTIKLKSLKKTVLPALDYNEYDMTGVYLEGTIFQKNSRLPLKRDFFQNVFMREVVGCIFPNEWDYKGYDYKDVLIQGSTIERKVCESILDYNLNEFRRLDLSNGKYNNIITQEEANIVMIRYQEEVRNEKIKLPPKLKRTTKSYDEII